ncbi:helix-turn-helix domain-containing protein [Actinokineospora sp. 24-640]
MLLTAEQAAARLQLRPSWLRRKAAARVIPCRYVGKHLRFTHSDVVAIAEQFASTPRPVARFRGGGVP